MICIWASAGKKSSFNDMLTGLGSLELSSGLVTVNTRKLIFNDRLQSHCM